MNIDNWRINFFFLYTKKWEYISLTIYYNIFGRYVLSDNILILLYKKGLGYIYFYGYNRESFIFYYNHCIVIQGDESANWQNRLLYMNIPPD